MEKKLSVEELMKPRYEVIADWPGVAGRVMKGDIICSDGADNGFWVSGEPFTEGKLKDYPHLFKPLQWWERRKESEMPEYLKHTLEGQPTTYHKIEKWDMEILVGFEHPVEERRGCSILTWNPKYTYQPCDESEYSSYKQSIKS